MKEGSITKFTKICHKKLELYCIQCTRCGCVWVWGEGISSGRNLLRTVHKEISSKMMLMETSTSQVLQVVAKVTRGSRGSMYLFSSCMPTHVSQIIAFDPLWFCPNTFQWGSKYRYVAKTSTKETSQEDAK